MGRLRPEPWTSTLELGRLDTLTKWLGDLCCDRVGLQNAIDLDAHLPFREEVEATLAESAT
jgi:hypothetical protein